MFLVDMYGGRISLLRGLSLVLVSKISKIYTVLILILIHIQFICPVYSLFLQILAVVSALRSRLAASTARAKWLVLLVGIFYLLFVITNYMKD